MCRIYIRKRGFDREINKNRSASPRTRDEYTVYQVFLYRKGNYVKRFHERNNLIDLIDLID